MTDYSEPPMYDPSTVVTVWNCSQADVAPAAPCGITPSDVVTTSPGGSCSNACPSGTYLAAQCAVTSLPGGGTIVQPARCLECAATCQSCVGPQVNQCTACDSSAMGFIWPSSAPIGTCVGESGRITASPSLSLRLSPLRMHGIPKLHVTPGSYGSWFCGCSSGGIRGGLWPILLLWSEVGGDTLGVMSYAVCESGCNIVGMGPTQFDAGPSDPTGFTATRFSYTGCTAADGWCNVSCVLDGSPLPYQRCYSPVLFTVDNGDHVFNLTVVTPVGHRPVLSWSWSVVPSFIDVVSQQAYGVSRDSVYIPLQTGPAVRTIFASPACIAGMRVLPA